MTTAPQQLSRRAFLVGATAAGITTLLAACGRPNRQSNTSNRNVQAGTGASRGGLLGLSMTTVGQIDFTYPLAIPPLAASTLQNERRVFELVAQPGTKQILPGQSTETWGINGAFLGPTLRARRGEEVEIRFHNQLPETTSLHWHGMHLPARMDGGPHQPVARGETWKAHWTIKQPAATLWYHPHPHGETETHVYRGIAGLFIIDDENSEQLPLPSAYGIDDIPVIVQDKSFNQANNLLLRERAEIGMLGNTILVNGTYAPYLDVTTSKVRLRLLNGSTARSYNFGFDDNRAFQLIATDGGLLTAPYTTERIQLSPGERAEIVVELQPDTQPVLRAYAPDLGGTLLPGDFNGGNDSFDILQLRAAAQLHPQPNIPTTLAAIPPLQARDSVRTREFVLNNRHINNRRMDMSRIDEIVTVDTTEIWDVYNQQLSPHNFHIHDVQFQILDIDGAAPSPELAGWKDTVYLQPRTHYRLIMQFKEYTSLDVPYMYHCHLLWHEDQGMMGQFVVVEAGDETRVSQHLPHLHQH